MRLLLSILAATLLWAVAAEAHRSPTSRVHNMRHIAEAYFGPSKCDVGTMGIPIINRNGIRNDKGQITGWAGRFESLGISPTGHYVGCTIQLDRRTHYSTEGLCILVVHEFGHAAGYGHTDDETNVMYPYLIPYWKPCADGAANIARRR